MATALATAAARRAGPGLAVTADAGRIARAAHAMAARFQRGGRLLTFGIGLAAADAAHVAVEFAHPAMAGRRALPAIPLAADACALTASGGNGSGPLTAQLRMLGRPHDIALGILGPGRPDGDVPAALAAAREIGMLTVALATGEHADRDPREDGTDPARASASPGTAATPLAAHLLAARSGDPLIVREIPHHRPPAVGAGARLHGAAGPARGGGAPMTAHPGAGPDAPPGAPGLHPFPGSGETGLDGALATAARLVEEKAKEIMSLRERVLERFADRLLPCAAAMAAAFRGGGRLFAFGTGGCGADAQAVAHLFRSGGRGLPALRLPTDVAYVTALGGGAGRVFARQIAALGAPGDIAVALATCDTGDVGEGLAEARHRGMVTVGIAGPGGERMAEGGVVDHLFVVPSSSVHRVQEAQATICHVLWELVHRAMG